MKTASPTLRDAHVSEAPQIAALSRLHVEHGLRWRWTPARVRRHIAAEDHRVLVATRDGEIVGFAIMYLGAEAAHLYLLAVRPGARNAGIGSALLGRLEAICRDTGRRSVRLEVREPNGAARSFYRARGYVETGVRTGYYDARENAVQMIKALPDSATG